MEKTLIKHGENLKSIHLADIFNKNYCPLIVLFPAFEGHSEFILTYATRLVDQGFQVFIADMYGNGKHLTNIDDCLAEIQPLLENRQLVRTRASENLKAALEFTDLEPNQVGIMGFCLGGMCALELARSGFDCPAIFAAHARLQKSTLTTNLNPKTNIMLAQGYTDPMVGASELEQFANEMQTNNWSCLFYGNTKHSFTDQNVGKLNAQIEAEIGREYSPIAAQSCFQQAVLFFENYLC